MLRRIAPLIVAIVVLCITGRLFALTTEFWDGTGLSWNAAADWSLASGATLPDPASTPDITVIVDFNISTVSTAQTINLDANQGANGLILSSTGTVQIQTGTGTNTLSIGANGITLNANAGAVTISSLVSLSIGQSWINNSSNLLTVSNNIANGPNALGIAGGGNVTLGGILGNGTGGLVMGGTGTLTLNGANTFSGLTTISSGTIVLGNAAALGSNGNGTNIDFGGTLDLNGQTIGGEALTIAGTGVGGNGALINGTFSISSISGTINASTSGSFSVGGLGVMSLSGAINGVSGSSVLTKTGSSQLLLGGTGNNAGLQLVVNSGGVTLGKSSSATVHSVGVAGLSIAGGLVTVSGSGGDQIPDTAPVTITSGALDLSGNSETVGAVSVQGAGDGITGALSNTAGGNIFFTSSGMTLTGNTSIGVATGGILNINSPISGNFALTKIGGGTLTLFGTGSNTITGATTISAGTLQCTSSNALSSSSALIIASGATLNLNALSQGVGSLTGAGNVTSTGMMMFAALTVGSDNTSPAAFSGIISNSPLGAIVGLTKLGSGTLTLSGANTYLGNTFIAAGTVLAGATNTIPANSAMGVALGATFNLGGFSQSIGSITNGGSITTTGTSGNDILTVGNDNDIPLPFSGVLSNAPGGRTLGLTKVGSGTQILSGANTFSGGIVINGGTLKLAGVGALNAGGVNTLGFGGPNATLDMNGFDVAISGFSSSGVVSDVVQNVLAPATLTINIATDTSFNGSINGPAGNLAVVKSGAGTLSLGGNNGFTSLTINAGTVQPAIGSGLPTGANIIFGPASTGMLSLNGFGVTVRSLNTDANPGTPIVQNGTIALATLSFVGTSATSVFNGKLQDGSSAPLNLFINEFQGQVTLGGSNSFTGSVTILAGNLILTNASALGAANAVNFDAGSAGLLSLKGVNTTIGGLNTNINVGAPIVQNLLAPATLTINLAGTSSTYAGTIQDGVGAGPLSLIKTGIGSLTLNGTNTFTGNLTINGGSVTMTTAMAANVINNATFIYNAGIFSGRLTNAGTLILNADITAGNGMENDALLSIPAGRTVTLNGAGLDNEGALALAGGTLILGGASNINHGTFTISATQPFNLGTATLTNSGFFNLNGGTLNATGGALTNAAGGTLSGNGLILNPLNNSGLIVVLGGSTNISQAFANSGIVQLASFTSSLSGGAITNTGSIQGLGNLGNAITNSVNGTIEAIGGTLFLGGAVQNQAGALLTAGAGEKILVTAGMAANAGTISLTGGTFDNNGHALVNTGEISGYGIFRTGGAGLTNNGSVTFTGGTSTINGDITNGSGKSINIRFNPAIFTGNITNNAGGTIKITSTTATFTGTFTNNGNFNSDPAINVFQGYVAIGGTGAMTGGVGDVFTFSGGTFTNSGTFGNGGTLTSAANVRNSGTFTQSGPQTWGNGTSFTNDAGTATFQSNTGSASAAPLSVVVNNGTVNLAASQNLNSVTINNGHASITAGVSKTNALTFAGTLNSWMGQLDVQNNAAIVEASDSADKLNKLVNLANEIQSGHAAGNWTGNGITSSIAAADPVDYGVGLFDGALLNQSALGGVTLDAQSIVVAAARVGDASFDGHVDGADLAIISANWGLTNAADWSQGDLNGDHVVNALDVALVVTQWDTNAPYTPQYSYTPRFNYILIATPEPASLAMLAVGMMVLAAKRRVR